jgi:hypothetical protein
MQKAKNTYINVLIKKSPTSHIGTITQTNQSSAYVQPRIPQIQMEE